MTYDELVALVKSQTEAISSLQQQIITLLEWAQATDRHIQDRGRLVNESLTHLAGEIRKPDPDDWWKNGGGENPNA